MDDNDLNHLIGERDAMKWVDGFLTVVPDADRDLMHTWFACAIESGRMTVQGEHEQDGEARIYVTASEARLIGDAYFTGSPDALDRAHDVIARLADAADGRGESEPDGDTDA